MYKMHIKIHLFKMHLKNACNRLNIPEGNRYCTLDIYLAKLYWYWYSFGFIDSEGVFNYYFFSFLKLYFN